MPYMRAMPVLMLWLALTGHAQGALATDRAGETPPDDGITLNLQDADIRALVNTVAEITGRNFVIDPRVKGKVTVISSEATSKADLYDIFLSILRVHGYAAVPAGDVIKIVPEATAKQDGAPRGREPAAGARALDELVTAVIPLQHAEAATLVPVLRPLLPQEAHLAAYPAGNFLVAADTAGNIERILDLVHRVDQPAVDSGIELIALENATASDVVDTLTQLTRASAGASPKNALSFVADARTNSLLLTGTEPEKLRLRALISKLDLPVDSDAGIEVVYLKFASADELAPVVQGMFDGGGAQAGAPGSAAAARVQFEANTNALIVQGSPADIRRMKRVIAQLDIRRSQVLVEGVIAEVSTNAADELGIQWTTQAPQDGGYAGTSLPGTASGALPNPFSDDFPTALGTGLTLGYFSRGSLRSLIRALSTDAYTNVLSTPTLVTLDNAQAEILVGQNVPFITGQFTNDATTPDNPFQTIERQDVGIILRVRPQINEGGTVTLEIEQEVSSIDRDNSGSDLITNERRISTTVLVDDSQTIVLGGLVTDELRENEQKVPIIGDIPLIGLLFRNSRDDVTRQNLMVFLRPTILKDQAEAKHATDRRYDNIRDRQFTQESRTRALFPRNTGPLIDTFDGLIE